jgi:hypothetical protein
MSEKQLVNESLDLKMLDSILSDSKGKLINNQSSS